MNPHRNRKFRQFNNDQHCTSSALLTFICFDSVITDGRPILKGILKTERLDDTPNQIIVEVHVALI